MHAKSHQIASHAELRVSLCMSKVWLCLGYPKYAGPQYSKDQESHHNWDNLLYDGLVFGKICIVLGQA